MGEGGARDVKSLEKIPLVRVKKLKIWFQKGGGGGVVRLYYGGMGEGEGVLYYAVL